MPVCGEKNTSLCKCFYVHCKTIYNTGTYYLLEHSNCISALTSSSSRKTKMVVTSGVDCSMPNQAWRAVIGILLGNELGTALLTWSEAKRLDFVCGANEEAPGSAVRERSYFLEESFYRSDCSCDRPNRVRFLVPPAVYVLNDKT